MNNVRKTAKEMAEKYNMVAREIENNSNYACVLYVKQLNNTEMLTRSVISPVMKYFAEGKKDLTDAKKIANSVICSEEIKILENESDLKDEVLNGMCALLTQEAPPIIINLKKVEKTSPSQADINYSIRGAKDSFTENLDTNVSLIRYRIKDESLKLDTVKIGRRTKTTVLIGYIENIANTKYVKTIKERLKKIDIDGINEAGKLLWFLNDKPYSFFPQAGMEQRSDNACTAMLDGKVVVICEGSGIALILPKVFSEFIFGGDEESENIYFSLFSRIVRIGAILISLFITPFYMAAMLHHGEALQTAYAMVLASGRAGVMFDVVAEAFLMEMFVEILREALIRAPKSIGSSIGIVGGIVVGSAIVDAKIFSPMILIIVSMSLLSSFVMPDISISNAFRIIKFLFMLCAWAFGIVGLVCGAFIMVLSIVSDTSIKTPYMAPFAPFELNDSLSTLYSNKRLAILRPKYLHTKAKIKRRPL